MPNWVTNTVKVQNFDVLKEKLLTEDGEVDFNKLLPMPKDLEITAGGCEWLDDNYNMGFFKEQIEAQTTIIEPILDEIYNQKTITQDEFIQEVEKRMAVLYYKFTTIYKINTELKDEKTIKEDIRNVLKGYYNLRTYGTKNWYEWCRKNWSTKWNVGTADFIYEDYKTICFQTAWSTPEGIFRELSKYTKVAVRYADEDTGRNYGLDLYENGELTEVINDRNKSIGEAYACRGESLENIADYYCEDNYTDDEMQKYFGTDRETFINEAEKDFNKAMQIIDNTFDTLQ